ncbi:hypothetical protein [Ensifer adhaerens]
MPESHTIAQAWKQAFQNLLKVFFQARPRFPGAAARAHAADFSSAVRAMLWGRAFPEECVFRVVKNDLNLTLPAIPPLVSNAIPAAQCVLMA